MADNLNVRSDKTSFSSDDEGDDKWVKARKLVVHYYNDHRNGVLQRDNSEPWNPLNIDDVYVVKADYTLGHWKAWLSTVRPDGRYYEVTYNSTKGETYIDEYQKQNNVCIKDPS